VHVDSELGARAQRDAASNDAGHHFGDVDGAADDRSGVDEHKYHDEQHVDEQREQHDDDQRHDDHQQHDHDEHDHDEHDHQHDDGHHDDDDPGRTVRRHADAGLR